MPHAVGLVGSSTTARSMRPPQTLHRQKDRLAVMGGGSASMPHLEAPPEAHHVHQDLPRDPRPFVPRHVPTNLSNMALTPRAMRLAAIDHMTRVSHISDWVCLLTTVVNPSEPFP